MDLDRFWDLDCKTSPYIYFAGINHSYLSTIERQARSNLIKLLFADNESDVSSTICKDPANQNQIQSQDELTNPNPSNTMDTRENEMEKNLAVKVSLKVVKK